MIISLIGLIGNGMVVYIFWNKRRGSAGKSINLPCFFNHMFLPFIPFVSSLLMINGLSIVDTLVLNLALADFLYCISLLFLARQLSMNGEWDLGEILCKTTSAWTIVCIYASGICETSPIKNSIILNL